MLHNSNDRLGNAIVIVSDKNISNFMIWKKTGDKFKVGSNSGYNEQLRKLGITYSIVMIKGFHDKFKNIKYSPKVSLDGSKDFDKSDLNPEHGVFLFNKKGFITLGDKVIGPESGNDPTTTHWAEMPVDAQRNNDGNMHTHTNEGRSMNGGTGEYAPSMDDLRYTKNKIGIAVSENNIYFYGGDLKRIINIDPNKFGESTEPVKKTYTPK